MTPALIPITRRVSILASALILSSCAWWASEPAQPIHLRVIAFNDFHGNLEAGDLNLMLADPTRPGQTLRVATGGAAALAGLTRELRKGAPNSLVISSGDLIGATPLVSALFRHESTVEVMNQVGVDVGTVGNHEFDAGLSELRRVMGGGCAPNQSDDPVRSCALQPYAGMRFPLVVANVRDAQNAPILPPYRIVQAGPVKVGIIGAVTRTTPQMVVPSGVAGLRFTDEAEAINAAALELERQGVRTLIATIHEGGEIGQPGAGADWNDPTCPGFRGDLVDIVRRLTPKVGLVLTAHTHQGYNCTLQGRHIMQAVSYGRGLSVADLRLDPSTGTIRPELTQARNLPVLNERTDAAHRQALIRGEPDAYAQALQAARPDADIQAQVGRYAQAAAPLAQRVVGRVSEGLDRAGFGDTSAGRFIAQAQWEATRAPERGGSQFALMNPGGVRTDLPCRKAPACEVTYGDLFSMQPFGNSLVVMSLSGEQVKRLLESQQRPGRRGPTPLMSPSEGLTYRWVVSAPEGQPAQDVRINGQPLDARASYRVTVNSFMADGGDGFVVLRDGKDRVGGPLDLAATLSYLARGAAPTTQPRVTVLP